MKFIDKSINKIYKFNFLKKNVFLIKKLNTFSVLRDLLTMIFSGKKENSYYEIKIDEFDKLENVLSYKLINVPNFFDFVKDINNGKNTLFKSLIETILLDSAFSIDTLPDLLNNVESIDWTDYNVIKNLKNDIEKYTDTKISFNLNIDWSDIISSSISMSSSDLSFSKNQEKLFITYMTIISYFVNILNDKNYHIVLLNPFNGLNKLNSNSLINILGRINNYSIITFFLPCYLSDTFLVDMKIEMNDIVDISEILSKSEEYSKYSKVEQNFENDLKEVISKIVLVYNNLESININSLFKENLKDLFLAIINKI